MSFSKFFRYKRDYIIFSVDIEKIRVVRSQFFKEIGIKLECFQIDFLFAKLNGRFYSFRENMNFLYTFF